MRYIPCRKRSQFRTQRKPFIFKLKVIPNKNPNPDDEATDDHRTSRRNSMSIWKRFRMNPHLWCPSSGYYQLTHMPNPSLQKITPRFRMEVPMGQLTIRRHSHRDGLTQGVCPESAGACEPRFI